MPAHSAPDAPAAYYKDRYVTQELPLLEDQISYADYVELILKLFYRSRELIRQENTIPKLLEYLAGEARELREAIEEKKAWIDVVAEGGDLSHFLTNLYELTGFPVPALLTWFNKDNALNDADHRDATVADVKQALVDPELIKREAIDLLEELELGLMIFSKIKEITNDHVAMFARLIFNILAKLDINIVYATSLKSARNQRKYPKKKMNDRSTTYEEVAPVLKKKWSRRGGDKKFFDEFTEKAPLALSHATVALLGKAA